MKETSSEITSSFVRDIHLIYAELFLGTPFVNLLMCYFLEHKKLQLYIISQLKSVCCQVFCRAVFPKLCVADPWSVGQILGAPYITYITVKCDNVLAKSLLR